MMRSGDGFESSYVSIESEIGFLWKGWANENITRQSGAAETGSQSQTCVTPKGVMLSVSRDLLRHTEYTSTDIE